MVSESESREAKLVDSFSDLPSSVEGVEESLRAEGSMPAFERRLSH